MGAGIWAVRIGAKISKRLYCMLGAEALTRNPDVKSVWFRDQQGQRGAAVRPRKRVHGRQSILCHEANDWRATGSDGVVLAALWFVSA